MAGSPRIISPMEIDNFDIIAPHLTFEPAMKFDSDTKELKRLNDTYDRYIIQILRRAKDPRGKSHGVNTGNRLLKTYEVSSREYLERKRPHIIDICRLNSARAYILPQVRSTYDCLKEMIRIGVDNLENPTIKFSHIMRSCMCAMHRSRDRKWVLDLDANCMDEPSGGKRWTVDSVMELVKGELAACGKDPASAYVVPTRSGHHIVTPPFNLKSAQGKCGMMFEGRRSIGCGRRDVGPGETEPLRRNIDGWLHKDGMTLLYYCDGE